MTPEEATKKMALKFPGQEDEEESVEIPDHVLAMILSMLTTPDLLKAMVQIFFIHCFIPSFFKRLFARGGCLSAKTNALCGNTEQLNL